MEDNKIENKKTSKIDFEMMAYLFPVMVIALGAFMLFLNYLGIEKLLGFPTGLGIILMSLGAH